LPAPVLVLIVEVPIELRQLMEDELKVGFHGTSSALKMGVVVVGIGWLSRMQECGS
jgi:hypothetical protein